MTRRWLQSATVEIDDSTGAILVKSGSSSSGQTQGVTKIWKTTGGDYGLTLDSLANNAGRMGGAIDLGDNYPRICAIQLTVKCQSAPTAGNTLEVYWAASADGTTWPGKVTGNDAVYPATVNDNKKQLLFIGCLPVTADISLQKMFWAFSPPARYGVPVIVNLAGQSLTNTNPSDHSLKLTPIYSQIQAL